MSDGQYRYARYDERDRAILRWLGGAVGTGENVGWLGPVLQVILHAIERIGLLK